MPTSFKDLVQIKGNGIYATEEHLERGRIWVFTPGNNYTNYQICWRAPAKGTAVIEIWGAGGSGARMCCCGGGLPGNAGAYSKKTIQVNANCYVCGAVGFSCGNADAICFRGCSDPTGVTWTGNCGASGCMCAQGGAGGRSFCTTGSSLYCCFAANGYCARGPYNDNCGTICNYFNGIWIACAYGGDVNRCGGFSCTAFMGCQGPCICSTTFHVATPPGYVAKCGGVVSFGAENNNEFSNWSGQGAHQHQSALNAQSRQPTHGVPWSYCWGFGGGCGCYENEGCYTGVGPGYPGTPPFPCGDVRDHGRRGGHGAIRIRFIEGQ